MSTPNIDVVKACFGAFGSRNVTEFLERMTEDVEWSPASSLVFEDLPARYDGHDGIRQWFDHVSTLAGYSITFADFAELDGETVLVTAIAVLTAPKARRGGDGLVYLLFEFREGRVRRLRSFIDEDEARRAARRCD